MTRSFPFRMVILACLAVVPIALQQARAAALPAEIGECSETTITEIGYRLGEPDTGSAISYANGGVQISYDTIPEIHRSNVGDPVKLCLVSLPEDCHQAMIAGKSIAPRISAPAKVGKRPTRSTAAAAPSIPNVIARLDRAIQ